MVDLHPHIATYLRKVVVFPSQLRKLLRIVAEPFVEVIREVSVGTLITERQHHLRLWRFVTDAGSSQSK